MYMLIKQYISKVLKYSKACVYKGLVKLWGVLEKFRDYIQIIPPGAGVRKIIAEHMMNFFAS